MRWMVPFAMAIKEVGSSTLKQFRGIPLEDLHNIQTHINTLDLLVSVMPISQWCRTGVSKPQLEGQI